MRIRASAMAEDASALVSMPFRRALVRITSVSVTSRSWSRSAMRSSRRRLSSSAFLSRALARSPSGPVRAVFSLGPARRLSVTAQRASAIASSPSPCARADFSGVRSDEAATDWASFRWRSACLKASGALAGAPALRATSTACWAAPRSTRAPGRGLAEAQPAIVSGASRRMTSKSRRITAVSVPRGLEASAGGHYDRSRRMRISLAHSPDSDDAFMFYGLARGKVPTDGLEIAHVLRDIETLNQQARDGVHEVTAVSFHAYAYVGDRYALMPCGGSIGDGYGPLLIAGERLSGSALEDGEALVAVPGTLTTATLALRLFAPRARTRVVPFDRILDEVRAGRADAGLVIHEGQLTFAGH